jgi:tRNA A37 threonylcarbamoyladenosine dehydratase
MSTENPFDRAELLLGREGLERLRSAKGLIFGVGGVGSWAAEALIRSGLGHLTMVDADSIHPTNVNRQAQATMSNIGQSKTSALRARLLEISPAAEIEAIDRMYDASTQASFDLKGFDFVIDAIDTLPCKTLLLKTRSPPGFPSTPLWGQPPLRPYRDPLNATIAVTKGCPLAKVLRQNLKRKA